MFCSRCGTEIAQPTQFCPTCGLDLRVTTPVEATAGAADLTDVELVREALKDEFELLEELGRGGMAIVLRARERHLEREVAVKVLPFSLAFDAEFVERFTREARTAAGLEHPNIISIYRVGKSGRVIYFSMKMLRGGSLSSLLKAQKRLPPGEIRKLLTDTASALGYAHQRDIVHRDIKPDNIMFDEFGQCVVTDFGIAKAGTSSRLTGTGMSIGTPHYMSPEQARAQSIDGRSDLYSLGVVAYQALVGELPYDGEDSFSIGYKHIMEPIPIPLLDTVEERRLFEIVRRLMMKDPLDRFQTAQDLLKALEGQPLSAFTPGRRVSLVQAGLAAQPTSPMEATPSPRPSTALPPAPAVRTSDGGVPGAPVVDTPRRSTMRRSVAAREPETSPAATWILAVLLIGAMGGGAYYLYRTGQMGGTPGAAPAPVALDSTPPATRPDSTTVSDAELVIPEDARLDSSRAPAPAPAPPPLAAAVRPVDDASPDSGTVRLQGLPRGSQVMIDDRPVTQAGADIRVRAGGHELAVSAPGYQFFRDSIFSEAGGVLMVRPDLVPIGATPAGPGLPPRAKRALSRLDCEIPTAANKFGALCYDVRPLPQGPMRVRVPAGVAGVPSTVVLIVKVSALGQTLSVRTRTPSSEPLFTRAVEEYAQELRWRPAIRDNVPVEGWTQATFVPETP